MKNRNEDKHKCGRGKKFSFVEDIKHKKEGKKEEENECVQCNIFAHQLLCFRILWKAMRLHTNLIFSLHLKKNWGGDVK